MTDVATRDPSSGEDWIEYQMSAIVNLEGCLREKKMWARS